MRKVRLMGFTHRPRPEDLRPERCFQGMKLKGADVRVGNLMVGPDCGGKTPSELARVALEVQAHRLRSEASPPRSDFSKGCSQ